MHRLSRIAAGAALVCSAASAQQTLDRTHVYPVASGVKDAGVYVLSTGRLIPHSSQGQLAAAQQTVYNNTCFWGPGAPFVNFGIESPCDDSYDEGRIPASGPPGAGVDNATNTWAIGYCTGAVTGAVDIDWAVFDTNSMPGTAACTTPVPSGATPLVAFTSAAAGFPLPGATTTGAVACWTVTFTSGTASVCMQSGATANDLFSWRIVQNNTIVQTGSTFAFPLAGPLLCADPNLTAAGAGTYNIPPGTDGVTGLPCGTGLGTSDFYWVNTDGIPAGGTPPPACAAQGAGGTGCYFFGGYPASPFASFYMQIDANGGCSCDGSVVEYCTAKTASNGCVPDISSAGVPSASQATGFVVTTSKVFKNKNGVHFYSTNGTQGVPFQGGFLCMKQPIKRLPVQNSGSSGPACGTDTASGSFVTDFNTVIAGGTNPALVAGALVAIQAWYRDPASPSTTGLSEARSFTICP